MTQVRDIMKKREAELFEERRVRRSTDPILSDISNALDVLWGFLDANGPRKGSPNGINMQYDILELAVGHIDRRHAKRALRAVNKLRLKSHGADDE